MNKGPLWIRRIGRRLIWPHPNAYRLIHRMRRRCDWSIIDFDLWIDGYPRSANTFTLKLFQLANPGARLRPHTHLPPPIIQNVRDKKPGIFLLRKPRDAAISWAIFWRIRLEPCLDYYIDFHRALLTSAPELFVAPFELVTKDFARVIQQFNQRFGTHYLPPQQESAAVSTAFSLIEDDFRNPAGEVNELIVCRPSPRRLEIKTGMIAELQNDCSLHKKLRQAQELHSVFAHHHYLVNGNASAASRLAPPLREAS
jgi:hypothetical protein